jgi:uncharacterized protein
MPSMVIVGLSLFAAVLFIGVYATIIGLPGTILIFCDTLIYALVTGFERIGITAILLLIVLAVLAEAIGIILDMNSRAMRLPSRVGILFSLIGALCGMYALTPALLGLGALLGLFIGGCAGFILAEIVRRHRLKPAFRASAGSLAATAASIVVKGFFAVVMTVITLTSIYS